MPTQADVNFVLAAVKYRFLGPEKAKELFEMYKVAESSGVTYPISNIAISYGYLSPQQAEQLKRGLQVKLEKKKVNQIANYRLVSKIGSGSMGVVYRAKHLQTGQDVALKILLKRFYDDPDYLERFYREAQASAQLNSPHLIRAIEAGKSKEGYHFFAMEYVDGETVQAKLDREKALPERQAIEVALQVARAIEHASAQGIVHRDIKPDNIMLTKSGVVKVADFGLARETDSSVTQTGIALGTPHYMSPEQVRGEHTVDFRSDLYSLGATLYHLVTGTPPFVGTSAAVVITKHLSEEAPSPREKNPQVSEGFSRIILKLMQKEQAARYQSIPELIRDLEGLLAGRAPGLAAGGRTPLPAGYGPGRLTRDRTPSGALPLATAGTSTLRRAPGAATLRRRRSTSNPLMENYVKPIFIGIAASLLCILMALGIYFTLRPNPASAPPSSPSHRSLRGDPTPETLPVQAAQIPPPGRPALP